MEDVFWSEQGTYFYTLNGQYTDSVFDITKWTVKNGKSPIERYENINNSAPFSDEGEEIKMFCLQNTSSYKPYCGIATNVWKALAAL